MKYVWSEILCNRFRLSILDRVRSLLLRLNWARRDPAARDEEQWRARVVPKVDGSCGVRSEICERCLQQNPIRSRHDVTFEGVERFGFCQRVCKRAMKLFRC